MAKVCDVCGRGPQFGNKISHAHNVSKRRWNINLQKVHAMVKRSRQAHPRVHFVHQERQDSEGGVEFPALLSPKCASRIGGRRAERGAHAGRQSGNQQCGACAEVGGGVAGPNFAQQFPALLSPKCARRIGGRRAKRGAHACKHSSNQQYGACAEVSGGVARPNFVEQSGQESREQ